MTLFRNPSGCRNYQDLKVLVVGVICTIFVFMVVSVYEGFGGSPPTHIDLIHDKAYEHLLP